MRSIDLAPTIAGLVSRGGFPGGDGRSLVRYWQEEDVPSLTALVESDVKMFNDNRRRPIPGVLGKLRAVRDGRFKLIATPTPAGLRLELYDLREDPKELHDLAESPEWSETRERLVESLFDALPADERARLGQLASRAAPDSGEASVSESELELLRSLGYIE